MQVIKPYLTKTTEQSANGLHIVIEMMTLYISHFSVQMFLYLFGFTLLELK